MCNGLANDRKEKVHPLLGDKVCRAPRRDKTAVMGMEGFAAEGWIGFDDSECTIVEKASVLSGVGRQENMGGAWQ